MTQTLASENALSLNAMGPDAAQRQEMLNAVGRAQFNALTGQIIAERHSARDSAAGWRGGNRGICRTGGVKPSPGVTSALKLLYWHGLHRRAATAGYPAQHAGNQGW